MPSASMPWTSCCRTLPAPSSGVSVVATLSGLGMPLSGRPSRSFSVMTSVTRNVPSSSSITR